MGVVRTSRGCRLLYFTIALLSAFATQPGHAQTTVAGFTPGSFRVNESGAATYSIPIQVPPGVAGMEPKLALSFSSQMGNGLLGVGWFLSGLSSIDRCGRTLIQDGLGVGVTYDTNDRYCLDGQRLILISPPPTVYGGDGAEYRTDRESFTKVISHGQIAAPGNGPLWFEVRTKSGQIIEYGRDDAPNPDYHSRIEAQGKTSVRIYSVNKISDTKGNFLTVTYTEDPPTGDFYPAHIDYTGNTAAGLAPTALVQLSYEARTDVGSSYIGGSLIKTQNRLTNVKTFVGATPVRDYRLSYEYSPNGGGRPPGYV